MGGFRNALKSLGKACAREFGISGEGTELNGHPVEVEGSTPVIGAVRFELAGKMATLQAIVTINRNAWAELRVQDPDAPLTRNRLKIEGEEMRVLTLTDDKICPWVKLQCGEIG